MSQLVAVIDLGKTNKKIVLFDKQLGVKATRKAVFPSKMGPDGILVEQIEAIWLWLTRELTTLYREHRFHAMSISTHGATWVALDKTGRPCLPVIAYEHDLGPAGQAGLDEDYYRLVGDVRKLQEETGTCDMPLLVNPAKSIRFAQRRLPGQWAQVKTILNYPQFWGYLLTGEMAAEPTYTANHSFLFDPRTRGPSSAAKALKVEDKIDWNLRAPWERLGVLRGDLQRELGLPPLPVTVGIHDSNGALLPYLVKYPDKDFVLNSTGTWCVAMHKVSSVDYQPDEVGQKVIFNLDAYGNPQKVSFLMGGMDYGLYHEAIGGRDMGFSGKRLSDALSHVDRVILPGAYPSQFPKVKGGVSDNGAIITVEALRAGRKPGWFQDTAMAHDLLNVSLALQSEVALRRTGIKDGTTIFVEGGFRNNGTFLGTLAALFPKNPLALTNLEQASAAGAALLGHALLGHCLPQALAQSINITVKAVRCMDMPHLAAYREAWLKVAHGADPVASPAGSTVNATIKTAAQIPGRAVPHTEQQKNAMRVPTVAGTYMKAPTPKEKLTSAATRASITQAIQAKAAQKAAKDTKKKPSAKRPASNNAKVTSNRATPAAAASTPAAVPATPANVPAAAVETPAAARPVATVATTATTAPTAAASTAAPKAIKATVKKAPVTAASNTTDAAQVVVAKVAAKAKAPAKKSAPTKKAVEAKPTPKKAAPTKAAKASKPAVKAKAEPKAATSKPKATTSKPKATAAKKPAASAKKPAAKRAK